MTVEQTKQVAPAVSRVLISLETPGYVHVQGLTQASAQLVSELLTQNHTLYKTRWKDTLHNHLVHHLLAMWALGATPNEIQDMWDYNAHYQDPMNEGHPAANASDIRLKDPATFQECLGINDCYPDFLQFFENEIEEKGMEAVIREYLLQGDERANDILGRMFAGSTAPKIDLSLFLTKIKVSLTRFLLSDLVHPIIHLGCAIEFHQPSLVAEALAGACVHENWPKTFLIPTEEYARIHPNEPSQSMLQLLESLSENPDIAGGTKETDPFNKIPDGFLKRVTPAQLVPYLARFQVQPNPTDLQDKMSDMMHTNAYMLAAAQRPGKHAAMDFVTLHAVTLAVFFPAILAQPWLSDAEKARLLEATVRVGGVMYAGTGCPPLYADRVVNYIPRQPSDGWTELFHRANVYRDEGHAAKLIRSLYALEQLDLAPGFPIAKQDFFLIAHMGMDSIERAMDPDDGNHVSKEMAAGVVKRVGRGGDMVVANMTRWVFYGGLPNAWRHVPNVKS
ncbi:hypothetical protein N7454_000188 [Penicillium verhagenii]|nr:hypothetical protein N7454_000188 [Penicillium verhagenii]